MKKVALDSSIVDRKIHGIVKILRELKALGIVVNIGGGTRTGYWINRREIGRFDETRTF